MKPLHLEEIRRAIHGRMAAGPLRVGGIAAAANVQITGVSTDTRTCKAGDLFFAIRGERFDGHAFLSQAASAGCAAAVVAMSAKLSDGIGAEFPCGLVFVDDATAALGELAAYHRDMIPPTVIAVTGSNGKTTTKRIIHHILSKRFKGTCSPKSFNNNIGVPLTLLGACAGDDYVVCEVGTNAPGEIAALASIIRPNIAVITSVGPTHLERLGTVADVAVEKASLLGRLHQSGLAVVWADSGELNAALRAWRCKTVRFGAAESADLRLTGYRPSGSSQSFQLNGRLRVELPLAGRHNAFNALAAIAVAQRLGFTPQEAAAALADFAGGDMRLEWLTVGSVRVINDAYNANPASMLAAAAVLAEAQGSRRVLIAGDMRELGDQSRALHERSGADIAAMNVDLLIGVGELGRYIARGASEGGKAAESFDSVEEARSRVAGLLREGDVVLVKGSRAMAMERLIEPIRAAFDPVRRRQPVQEGRKA